MTPLPAIEPRITVYASRVDWVRNANRGAPAFEFGGTSCWDALMRPWTCWDKALSWDGAREAEREANSDLDDGIWWERAILDYAAEKHDFRLLEVAGADKPFRVRHPSMPWLNVSPDALALHPVWGLGVIDVKTGWRGDVWADDGDVLKFNAAALGQVAEPKYLTQGAALVEAVDADWFGIVAAVHFRDVRFLRFDVDRSVTAGIVGKVAAWRERHLVGGAEPEYDASAEAVNWRAQRLAEVARDAQPNEVEMAIAYREARAAEAAAKARKAGLKAALVKSMHEYEPGPDDGPAKGQHKLVLPDGGRVTVSKKNGALRVSDAKE